MKAGTRTKQTLLMLDVSGPVSDKTKPVPRSSCQSVDISKSWLRSYGLRSNMVGNISERFVMCDIRPNIFI